MPSNLSEQKKKKCGWVRRKRLLGRNGTEIPATLSVSWYFSIFGNDTLESWNLVFSLFLIKAHFNYLSVFSPTTLSSAIIVTLAYPSQHLGCCLSLSRPKAGGYSQDMVCTKKPSRNILPFRLGEIFISSLYGTMVYSSECYVSLNVTFSSGVFQYLL